MARMLLDIRNLSVRYGSTEVLQGVSMSVSLGQVVGIVGESGSGKTTLARSILAALSQSAVVMSGSITYKGKELIDCSHKSLQEVRGSQIGMIFQDPRVTFSPVKTIGSQFEESLFVHAGLRKSEAKKLALATMQSLGLEDGNHLYDSYAFELSGGMCQRAAIALAMCLQPALLIADEPTSALDVTVQALVLQELKRLKETLNTSMIVISHDLRVIAAVADELYVMHQGKIVEKGACQQVLTNPQHSYTAHLIASVPRFSQKVQG